LLVDPRVLAFACKSRGRWFAPLVFVSGVSAASGCAHPVAVPAREVPDLARYGAGGPVRVDDQGVTVSLTREKAPELEVHLARSCDIGALLLERCDRIVTTPLERVRVEGRTLHLEAKTALFLPSYREVTADVGEVESASVLLHGYDPPTWRPTWGVGFAAGGASGIAAVEGQWLPTRWLGVELGALPAADAGAAFAAMRLRPIPLGPFRPFFGWFANAAFAVDPASGTRSTFGGVGPRVGLDTEIVRGHVLITVEGDLAHQLGKDELYFGDEHGRWVPWGGGGVAYFF
jgi:hypothetical protein